MKVLQGKHIFIVEDDPLNRLVFRLALNKAGASVEFDACGNNTLSLLQTISGVDMILLDLMLPRGQSGYDLYQVIRTLPLRATTPIVAVSAIDPGRAITRTRAMGFQGFIPKPIDSETFPYQLAQILQGVSLWEEFTISELAKFNALTPYS